MAWYERQAISTSVVQFPPTFPLPQVSSQTYTLGNPRGQAAEIELVEKVIILV